MTEPNAEIAAAWAAHAPALAKKAAALFATGYSDWVAFLPERDRRQGRLMVSRDGSLNVGMLERHFRGASVGDLLAMPWHSTPSGMGIPIWLWTAFTVAPSREEDRASGGLEGIIESSAIRFAEIIKATGMEPLVEEYDAEEYRIWVLPGLDSLMEWEDGPYPSEVERWARSLEQRIGAARVAFTHIAPLPGRHHFSGLDGLADQQSPRFAGARRLMKLDT